MAGGVFIVLYVLCEIRVLCMWMCVEAIVVSEDVMLQVEDARCMFGG